MQWVCVCAHIEKAASYRGEQSALWSECSRHACAKAGSRVVGSPYIRTYLPTLVWKYPNSLGSRIGWAIRNRKSGRGSEWTAAGTNERLLNTDRCFHFDSRNRTRVEKKLKKNRELRENIRNDGVVLLQTNGQKGREGRKTITIFFFHSKKGKKID